MANPNGKAILRASLDLFRQDRQMIWLPVMATVTAVIAFAIVSVPLTLAFGRTGLAVIVALACGYVGDRDLQRGARLRRHRSHRRQDPHGRWVARSGVATQGRHLQVGDFVR